MPGLYNMTKTNQNGCTDSAAVGTRVVPGIPVVADYTQDADTVCIDSTISFANSSTGQDTTTWDFGDGNLLGTTNATHSYAATGTFTVTLTVSGDCGTESETSTVVVVDCSVGREPGYGLPDMALGNLPNPFAGSTSITFSIPEAGNVALRVFNALGIEVATVANGFTFAGDHQVDWNAGELGPGVYFYRLEFAGYTLTRRMLILK